MVRAVEVFIKAPDIQYCDEVKIILGTPFSEVFFKDYDFLLASKIVSLKFLGGYNDINDVNIFLNNNLIENCKLLFWDNNELFEEFINNNKKHIKDDNKYTIEFIDEDNFEYCKHLLVYTQIDKNDYSRLEKEAIRWKSVIL